MNTGKMIAGLTAAALLLVALPAWAQPKVEISIKAEKEVTVTAKGKQVKRRLPAKGIEPGEELIYTLNYANVGSEPAKDVVISDPIPSGTAYIPGSATDAGEVTFSIDKGKSFNKPTLLSYEVRGKDGKSQKRVATPEDYTDIRWTIPAIPVGEKGSVSFKVKVK